MLKQFIRIALLEFILIFKSKKKSITSVLIISESGLGDFLLYEPMIRQFLENNIRVTLCGTQEKLVLYNKLSSIELVNINKLGSRSADLVISSNISILTIFKLLRFCTFTSLIVNPYTDRLNIKSRLLFLRNNQNKKFFFSRFHASELFFLDLERLTHLSFHKLTPNVYLHSKAVENLHLVRNQYGVINVGGSDETRKLTLQQITGLVKALEFTVVLIGSETDRGRYSSFKSNKTVVNLVGVLALEQLNFIVKGARFVASPDSFPAHLAAAHGVRAIVLMGNTSKALYEPLSSTGHLRVIHHEPSCSPCSNRSCKKIQGVSCVQAISSQEIELNIKDVCSNPR